MRMNEKGGGLVLALLVTACAPETTEYTLVADVPQLMSAVLDPAAEVYRDAVGWILDFEGVHEIAPANDEEWLAVSNAAYVIAESGNLLMMDGRAQDGDGWMAWSRALTEIGRTAIQAADARDEAGVFDAGAEIYYVCSGCHAAYALEIVRPSDIVSDSTEQ